MKNRLYYIFLIFIFNNLFNCSVYSTEIFNFDVTELEIIEEGNKFIGKNEGTATSEDGTIIKAKNFEYDKIKNILVATGNVEIIDKVKNIIIKTKKITYLKNKEFIFTEEKSKAISDGVIIDADNFEYNKIDNIINANGNVKINDQINDYLILANEATYKKNYEKIITRGKTKAFIQSKYIINSKNVTYLHDKKVISSQNKTKIDDQKSKVYFANKFNYSINQELIKGEDFLIITNHNLPNSDKIFLKSAIIDLKNNKFIAKNTKIKVHKDIFDNSENDPRIEGVSSRGDENYTLIKKGVFTSCKKNDDCPPWSIQSEKIKHDKIKKTLNYDNAILKIYDVPVFYFPKFFHPDPSVKRQSGLLKPEINNSNVLGSSLTLPYYKVISKNRDLTFTPTWFDSNTSMIALEYRQENKNSSLLTDLAFINGYKSPTTKKKNSMTHFFLNLNKDLQFEDYISSNLKISLEKVSADQYLKIFDQYITKSTLRPLDFDSSFNEIKISLDHEKFNFESGIESYEALGTKNKNDRYQYVLPYYGFEKKISQNYFNGNISFFSSGSNVLKDTNKLETRVINNLNYNSLDFITNLGFKNNFGVNFKNLNSVGKKSSKYKSGIQSEIISLYNVDVSLPLIKESKKSKNLLTPKMSFRFNPSDMKNYSDKGRTINADNIWSKNRLGLSDTFESGRSLTLGINYNNERKNKLDQINNYFEMKLATVLRDKEEKFIPNGTTLHRKNSNLFGSITNDFSENTQMGYHFSLDNDFNKFEYNEIFSTLTYNDIIAKFTFVEENGERGDANLFATSFEYNLDDENYFSFATRRNRKLNLTEFYDLVYEYKNDCLTAGIKYKKTYYSDRDLKPTQNLLFTITLFPLTTYEHDANDLLKNEDSFLNNLEFSSEIFK